MKQITPVLITLLLAAGAPQSAEAVRLLYRAPSGAVSLGIVQEIEVRVSQPVEAGRKLSFDLGMVSEEDSVTVKIEGADATYTAHAVEQRLGTRHLDDQALTLSIADDGRRLTFPESSANPVIDLGPPLDRGFSLAETLIDVLPVLPDAAVREGDVWKTERTVRCLVGWAWGSGALRSRHRVEAVEDRDGRTLVTVVTESAAGLSPLEDGDSFEGEMRRTASWVFDATAGGLLSLSMEQETTGSLPMHDDDIPIFQRTLVEWVPVSG